MDRCNASPSLGIDPRDSLWSSLRCKPRGGPPPDRIWCTFCAHGRVSMTLVSVGWLAAIVRSTLGHGGPRGAWPPYPTGVEEPDADPHLGGPPKGALWGGPGGFHPPGSRRGASPGLDGGISGKPPGGENSGKSAHFVGYLINLPFGTNMVTHFFGFFAFFGQTWPGQTWCMEPPFLGPPTDPPFLYGY